MSKLHKLTYIFLALTISISKLHSVPACPDPIIIKQADGNEITIRIKGDEFFHYTTTEDGYVLTPDADGILTYAKQDANGKLISTKVRANSSSRRNATERKFTQSLIPHINFSSTNMARRAMRSVDAPTNSIPQRAFPITGTPKSLVILVNFSDLSFVTPNPKIAFTNLLNEPSYATNGGTGSAKDYFNDNSMGVFNPQFDVVGPFTLPNPMIYYGKNENGVQGQDTLPRIMVIDACTLASASGVDFSQYDTDKNGIVDNVFIYYAGHNEAEGASVNTIWPHRWSLANKLRKFNNVAVYDYACTSELRSSTGSNMCGIGTFCHEFGHVLGLPDYYPTNGATHHTLSYWNIMDSGPYLNSGRTPPAYSAFDRFYLNWLIPTEIKNSGNYSLENLSTSNKAFILTQNGNHNLSGSNPNPTEFFTLENRQKSAWDFYLPGHGMLITHIQYNSTTWNSNSPNNDALAMGVDIVEADGLASSSTLSGDPFPGTSNILSYNPTLQSGIDIFKPISSIQETNGLISFNLKENLNAISAQPTVSSNSDKLEATVNANGELLVRLTSNNLPTNATLYIFNLLGQCVKTFKYENNTLNISDLRKNNLYILRISGISTIIKL